MSVRFFANTILLCLILLRGLAASERAGDPLRPVPRFEAVQLKKEAPVRVDGKPDDTIWQTIFPTTEFVQRDPKEGGAPHFGTEVRAAFDQTALYVLVCAKDLEPAKISRILTRRDGSSPSDWIRVLIDSYHDKRTAYEFSVNPAGVKQDSYWSNDGNNDSSWDSVWEVAVSTDTEGWKAEFRIPFSQLRFNPGQGDTFGFAVMRQIGRLNETSSWPLIAKSKQGFVSQFGELGGLRQERSPERLELMPYFVSQLKTQPAEPGNPFIKTKDPGITGGLDLKYALTPGLTLTATLNPDFGQVEADPAVVNLSAFETFYAERRPFFIEGSGIFQFNLDCNDGACTGLFYSRRIGRQPQGDPGTPANGFSSTPQQTTILSAEKLTGRIGKFSVGALNAITSEEHARIADGSRRYENAVEPLTSYTVIRATREFQNQSSLGFMSTATNRRLNDHVSFLPGQAYAGGVDWDWRLGKKGRYSLSGNFAGSNVRGSRETIDRLQQDSVHAFQRPDADHVTYDPMRTQLNGHTGSLSLGKIGGEHIRFNTNAGYKSPGFEINDLGYMQRADTVDFGNWLQWRHDKPSRLLRSFRINFNQWNGWNLGGDRLNRGVNINAHATTVSNWSTGGGFNINLAGLTDRSTRGGPAVATNHRISFWQYVEGDNRRRLYPSVFCGYGRDWHGSFFLDFSPEMIYRPSEALKVSFGISYSRNIDDSQWVNNVEDGIQTHHVFGHLRQTTLSLTPRVDYTITPTLSIQIYAQPFVSAGAYSRFKEVVQGRAVRYEDRYAPHAYGDNPDFNYRSFRTTDVLRWEYRPGSALFVVWQQGREDVVGNGDFRFSRDFGGAFRAPGTNVFLVKLVHWLNY